MSWIGLLLLAVAIYAAIKVVGALLKIALWGFVIGALVGFVLARALRRD